MKRNRLKKTQLVFWRFIAALVLVLIIIAVIFRLFNASATHIIESLGILALIVSLALQSLYQDIFAFISIHRDKLYFIGDYIETESVAGTVNNISLRTTTITAVGGYEVNIANRIIINQVINNHGIMKKRFIQETIYFETNNDIAKIEEAITLIKQLLNQKFSKLLIVHEVFLDSIDPLGYQIKYTYSVKSAAYNNYIETQTLVNTAVASIVTSLDIKLATN